MREDLGVVMYLQRNKEESLVMLGCQPLLQSALAPRALILPGDTSRPARSFAEHACIPVMTVSRVSAAKQQGCQVVEDRPCSHRVIGQGRRRVLGLQ